MEDYQETTKSFESLRKDLHEDRLIQAQRIERIQEKQEQLDSIIMEFRTAVNQIHKRMEEREKRMDEVFTAALTAAEAAHDIKRTVASIPQTIHKEIMQCIEPRLETVRVEIKAVEDQLKQHLLNHKEYKDFRFKTWQLVLVIPAVLVTIGTIIYNVYVALKGLFHI